MSSTKPFEAAFQRLKLRLTHSLATDPAAHAIIRCMSPLAFGEEEWGKQPLRNVLDFELPHLTEDFKVGWKLSLRSFTSRRRLVGLMRFVRGGCIAL
jgi:hypothetical protein